MNIIILCLIVTASIVYIWDFVAVPQIWANAIMNKISDGKIKFVELKKPFGCSLCMSTWITLILLTIFNWKLMPLCLVFGWSTKFILYSYQILDKTLSNIFLYIEKKLN